MRRCGAERGPIDAMGVQPNANQNVATQNVGEPNAATAVYDAGVCRAGMPCGKTP
jgi:hypothetical protein